MKLSNSFTLFLVLTISYSVVYGAVVKESKKNELKELVQKVAAEFDAEVDKLSEEAPSVAKTSKGKIADDLPEKREESSSSEEVEEQKNHQDEKVEKTFGSSSSEEVTETQNEMIQKEKPTYMTRVRLLMKRILELLGIKRQRENRMLDLNNLDYKYKSEVRAAVGAVMGKNECVKKAVCGVGSYLKKFNGKQVLLIFLEKLSPDSWLETVKLLKNSAISDMKCDYKCLES